jgi:hypothetical protein
MPESTLQIGQTISGSEEQQRSAPPRPALAPVNAPSEHAGLQGALPREKEALRDAEHLINYAADVGIDIDDQLRRQLLAARRAADHGWNEEHAANLLSGLTRLSARLRPVSAESLRKCVVEEVAARTIATYRRVAITLVCAIVPLSALAFVATRTCEAISKDIEVANALALTLIRQFSLVSGSTATTLAAPAQSATHREDALSELQQFAAANRDIHAKARTLRWFAAYPAPDPWRNEISRAVFQLPVKTSNLSQDAADKLTLYQHVRQYAQSVQEAVLTTFGAVTSCFLPILYALLGACACLIRLFEAQMKSRTFTGTDNPTARFLVAVIGGLVVGLFGNFGADHSLSPLAIAFLVGYAVDVFFFFLDRLLHTFANTGVQAPAPPNTAPPDAPPLPRPA